jgi:hypothetical protein
MSNLSDDTMIDIDEMRETADEVVETKEKVELPEAPISITVRGYYQGFSVLITKRNADGTIKIDDIKKAIDNMIEKGFKPSWADATNKASTTKEVDKDVPICGEHHVPMTWKTGVGRASGKPYAFWACPQKNADGTYCNWKSTEVKYAGY